MRQIRQLDFQDFCEETGRDWRNYANVYLILEFTEWVLEQLETRFKDGD